MRDQNQSDAAARVPHSDATSILGNLPRLSCLPHEALSSPRRILLDESVSPQLQAATPVAAQFHGRKRINGETRSTVQGSRIALISTKQKRKHFLTYGKPGFRAFALHASQPIRMHRNCFLTSEKINRHTKLIETPLSHRKQRTGPQINRHISQGPRIPFSLFTFPFSKRLLLANTQNLTHYSLIHPRLDVNPDSCYIYLPCFHSFSLSVRSLSRSLNPEDECRLGVRNRRFMGVGKISMEAF
jgi:hypothetical protein